MTTMAQCSDDSCGEMNPSDLGGYEDPIDQPRVIDEECDEDDTKFASHWPCAMLSNEKAVTGLMVLRDKKVNHFHSFHQSSQPLSVNSFGSDGVFSHLGRSPVFLQVLEHSCGKQIRVIRPHRGHGGRGAPLPLLHCSGHGIPRSSCSVGASRPQHPTRVWPCSCKRKGIVW